MFDCVLVLAILSSLGSFVACGQNSTSSSNGTPKVAHEVKDVTVQLFQWPHKDVTKECETHLSKAGFKYVQISPPQEHITGPEWWTDYQPVSYQLTSHRGTEAEFIDMVQRCKKVGVGVLVDVVLNHMAGATSAPSGRVGISGHRFTHYEYPGLFSYSDFHHCGRNGNDVIRNYSDRYEVQNCELLGLADLSSSSKKVQQIQSSYLTRLLDIGVSGFRIDAATHIAASDLAAILRPAHQVTSNAAHPNKIKVVQEVFSGRNDSIQLEEYINTGQVHIFQAAYDLKRMFESDGIASLLQPIPWGVGWGHGYLPSHSSEAFISNHDLEREDRALRFDSTHHRYFLATIFLLTWNYGSVTVYSGYSFRNFDERPILANELKCYQNGWRCEHRRVEVIGALAIRKISGDEPIRNILTSGKNRIAYSRGSRAVVMINNEENKWVASVPTRLPAGTYLNVFRNTQSRNAGGKLEWEGGFDGPNHILVSNLGVMGVNLPPFSAIGIHVGGRISNDNTPNLRT